MQKINFNEKRDELKKYIDKFPDSRVLVLGDIILDEYIWGDVSRISPEAPVPVVEILDDEKRLGGAANVLHNIVSLNGQADICGVIGDDVYGKEVVKKIKSLGLKTEGIIKDADRCTSIKTRVIGHNQQMMRIDREKKHAVDKRTTLKILGFLKKNLKQIDAVIMADYGKGVITSSLVQGVRDLTKDNGIILGVDPKPVNFNYYHGVDVITPNHHEAAAFCRFEINNEESLIKAGRKMLDELDCRSVLITRGKDGMALFEKGKKPVLIPTEARKVFDVSGAGDTVIATLCLGLASGMDLSSAAMISNIAAGIVVGEVGTSVVTIDELKKAVNEKK
jgi:D-glycero-beta-D-manno-heptose-7-phosphate kinase